MKNYFLITLLWLGSLSCEAQTKTNMEKTNPLLCNPETGLCEIPSTEPTGHIADLAAKKKPLKIIYYTDPICSSCWGIEPQLRKLKLEYGNAVEIDYHMGGLLPDWSYNSGGISKPSDVAHHWDEVSLYYKMPIDGDIWLEDPLSSSYPPSIAFKAAQMQNEQNAITFLRVMREMVFLKKKNIAKWEVIREAALQAGLDPVKLKQDYDGKASKAFRDDLDLAKQMNVRGFPSIFITDSSGNQEFIYGVKPYSTFESGIKKMYPEAIKNIYAKDWASLFHKYPTLTLREFAELSEISPGEAQALLDKLVGDKLLTKLSTKNGDLWIKA